MIFDGQKLKNQGLQFARALQVALKTAAVFPIEHKSSERPIRQSFDFLTSLLKGTGQFTFGFVDKEVMLNKVLTTDASLRPLEIEFGKRRIAAITFVPGLTFASYKRLMSLFAAPPPEVEAAGGMIPYVNQHPLDGMNLLAAKKMAKDEHGDTIIDTDSESYILAHQRGDHNTAGDFLESIEALLESGCFDAASRAEAMTNLAASSTDGVGYGVPIDIPKLAVVKDGEKIVPSSAEGQAPGGGGGQAYAAAAGNGPAGSVSGDMASAAFSGSGAPAPRRASYVPGPDTFLQLVEQSVTRSLSEEKGDPQKSLASLARLLNGASAERILERFPAERREELRQLRPSQIAAEYMEDTALQIAGEKFQSAGESNQEAIEEDVVTVLSRSLEATHLANRLAAKLAKFIQDFAIPPHVQEKINEELRWTTYDVNKRFAKLMALSRFSNLEFRRLLELGKELTGQRDQERTAALVNHYFEFLDRAESPVESSDLSRAPEIIQALSAAYSDFVDKTLARLTQLLQREGVSEFVHFQSANALSVLGQCAADREEFPQAAAIGLVLEKSRNLNPEKHARCCGAALSALITPFAVEQIVENHIQKRGDSASAKTNATLLRFAAPGSIEVVMERLVNESEARNRLGLVRLASQLGRGSIEVAAKYLADERWYVVRNMCMVLAELNDPDLIEHLTPALRHADDRVQQAALKALLKARGVKTAQILADSLSTFSAQVLDEALDQLTYLRSPNTVAALEAFVSSGKTNLVRATKAIQVLGAIPDVAGIYALGRIFRIEELDAKIRHAALANISSQRSAVATQLLQELSTCWGPLAEEAKKELEKRQFKKS